MWLEHLHGDRLVHPQPAELFLGQLPGLVEDLVRHDELADVVHQRGEVQPLPARRPEVQLFADVAGVLRDPLGVTGGVTVLRLERANQHLHGLVVRFGDAHVRAKHLPRDEDRHEDENERAGAEREVEPTDEEAQHCERKDLDAGRNQAFENLTRLSSAFAKVRERDQRPRDDEIRHRRRHHRENGERRRGDFDGIGSNPTPPPPREMQGTTTRR